MFHDLLEVFRLQQINTRAFWEKDNTICFHAKGEGLQVSQKPEGIWQHCQDLRMMQESERDARKLQYSVQESDRDLNSGRN